MNISTEQLARKYAQAFISVNIKNLTCDNIYHIYQTYLFLNSHPVITFFLDVPTIQDTKKIEFFALLYTSNNLKSNIINLLKILIHAKRGSLFTICLKHIWWLAQNNLSFINFNIKSSHKITQEQIDSLKTFLTEKTGKKIIYQTHIDKKLITGIRLQSDELLWEQSIKKQLRSLKQKVYS